MSRDFALSLELGVRDDAMTDGYRKRHACYLAEVGGQSVYRGHGYTAVELRRAWRGPTIDASVAVGYCGTACICVAWAFPAGWVSMFD